MDSRPWCCPVPQKVLPFIPPTLKVTRVVPTAEAVMIEATGRATNARCPECSVSSRRLHSWYFRHLRDLPWQGRSVIIRVHGKRYYCVNRQCPRRTFAEPLPDVAPRSSQRTARLRDLQRHFGLALGGEAGARLASRMSTPVSPDTLLRLASGRRVADMSPTPRVLGIDDWAWKRGRFYGTVLVDLETKKVVDLLPDREAATVAKWLTCHPGVEIVARDRAGAYSDGIRQGAPSAIQVADRWHLLRNLGDAVQTLGARHNTAARRAASQVRSYLAAKQSLTTQKAVYAFPPAPTRAQRAGLASHSRREELHAEMVRLKNIGVTTVQTSARLGIDRKTILRWQRLGYAPRWLQPKGDSILDPFKLYLGRRWSEGCRNATQLWRELNDLGFRGRPSLVREWATNIRRGKAQAPEISGPPLPPAWPVPSGYGLAHLLMADRRTLNPEDSLFKCYLLAAEPALAAAIKWAKRMNRLLRRRGHDDLSQLLTDAAETPLARFAISLRRGYDAIHAAVTSPWTTSPVEGHVCRIKMLKRSMYGRAGFELLRARVLNLE